MKKFSLITLSIFVSLFFLVVPSGPASALDLGSIISDREFTDANGMSLDFISRFLGSKSGRLGSYSAVNSSNQVQSAAEIIFQAARTYSINPKVIIVTLQKESSAITKSLSDSALEGYVMGFGVCDSCSKDDPRVQQYKGFFNQIDSAINQFRRYLDSPGSYRHQVGGTYSIDGVEVKVKNKASAALLNYTPHAHGNELFRNLWNQWFLQHYGNGSLLQLEGQPGIYLVQDNKLRPFISKSAFLANYDFKDVVLISRAEVDSYEIGASIQFPETALLQDSSTGGIYLHVQNTKKPIASREVFQALGFNPEEIVRVSSNDLAAIPTGDKITEADNFPLGALLQSKQTGGVVFVEAGQVHPIYAREILHNRFKNRALIKTDQSKIDSYTAADPIRFRDGTLITSPNYRSVYVIVDGQRRAFPSRDVFESLGYQWKSVIRTNDRAVEIHPEGGPVTIE